MAGAHPCVCTLPPRPRQTSMQQNGQLTTKSRARLCATASPPRPAVLTHSTLTRRPSSISRRHFTCTVPEFPSGALPGTLAATSGRRDVGETTLVGYLTQSPPPVRDDMRIIDYIREIADNRKVGPGWAGQRCIQRRLTVTSCTLCSRQARLCANASAVRLRTRMLWFTCPDALHPL